IWGNALHPDDRDRILQEDRRSIENGSHFVAEYRLVRRDGSIVWVKEDTNLICDQEGNPLYWQGILLDISKEKENEAELQRQLKELTVLHSASLAAANALDVDQLIEQITAVISDTLGPDNCGVLLVDKATNTLIPHASYKGTTPENLSQPLSLTQGVTGKVAQTGRPLRLGNVAQEPDYFEITEGIHSELCVPVMSRGQVIAV